MGNKSPDKSNVDTQPDLSAPKIHFHDLVLTFFWYMECKDYTETKTENSRLGFDL